MRKIDLINNTLGAAQAILTSLQTNGTQNPENLVLWCDALNRYVLIWPHERTTAQFLENVYQSLEAQPCTTDAIHLIEDFILELRKEVKHLTDLDDLIEWEPIFDRD